MFESPMTWVIVLGLVVAGLVLFQRLEFLSVFARRRRPPGGEARPPGDPPARD
ncbi:hypothetical protein [Muricoccus radiodurans]|uniref:hypothetical protein n=1 Tax=Muricoccus radiodurans TaxID=2231721 RepID=UPI003CE9FE91